MMILWSFSLWLSVRPLIICSRLDLKWLSKDPPFTPLLNPALLCLSAWRSILFSQFSSGTFPMLRTWFVRFVWRLYFIKTSRWFYESRLASLIIWLIKRILGPTPTMTPSIMMILRSSSLWLSVRPLITRNRLDIEWFSKDPPLTPLLNPALLCSVSLRSILFPRFSSGTFLKLLTRFVRFVWRRIFHCRSTMRSAHTF